MSHVLVLVAPPGQLDPALLARAESLHGPAHVLSPGEAAEFPLEGDRSDLAIPPGTDAFVVPETNRRKRLLIADMDSTIVTGETLDELAAFAGVGAAVAAITTRSMNGELDFAQALRARVALLRGLSTTALDRTWAGVHLTEGARTLVQTMKAHGAATALVSGGFTWFTARVAALCGFDHHRANTLLDDGGTLLGTVSEPILDRSAKRAALHELAVAHGIAVSDALAVGDGANDLDMIRAAGFGVAFHAKPIVAAEARFRVSTSLRALLFLQGYAAAEFRE